MIRLFILLLLIAPALALAQGKKNLYLPASKGKVYVYEDHSKTGKFLLERVYIGKSKTPNKEPLFQETMFVEDKVLLDTVTYLRLSQADIKSMRIGLVNKYDSTFAYRGCIPTYLDSLHYKTSDYKIHHQLHFMEFVNVGGTRYNNVLIVMTKVSTKNASDTNLIETMEFFYAAKLGLVAQVNTDSSGSILGSLELMHPKKGKWTRLHENGSVSAKMKYKKGERHGKHREWHSTGYLEKLWKYKFGNLQGEQLEYYEGELVKSKRLYEKGELLMITKYYENKQPSEEGRYKDGKRYGVWRKWDPAGKMIAEAEYVAGRVVDGYWPP